MTREASGVVDRGTPCLAYRRAKRALPGARRRTSAIAVLCLCGMTAGAQQQPAKTLEIWTSNAPLASVLEQIIDQESLDVRVGEDVEGLVSGRLEGTMGEVLEPLLASYGLTVHHDGSTVWFDRRGTDVVEHVALDPQREPILAEWAARELDGVAPNGKGRVESEEGELRVSGTRAFVQEMLGRIEAARGALGEERSGRHASEVRQPPEVLALPDVVDGGGTAVAAIPTMNDAVKDSGEGAANDGANDSATDTMVDAQGGTIGDSTEPSIVGPPYRSVSDIPGYYTEYR